MPATNWTKTVSRTALLAALLIAAPAAVLAGEPGAAKPAGEGKVLAGPKAGGPTTQPKEHGFGAPKQRGEMMIEILKDLNLTPEQQPKVREIMAEAKAKHEAWRRDHGAEADALKAQMKTAREANDSAKLAELRPKAEALMAAAPKPPETMAKIRALLTPEQQAKFDAKLAEERKAMGDRAGKMDGERKGPMHRGEGKGKGEGKPREGKPGEAAKGDKLKL